MTDTSVPVGRKNENSLIETISAIQELVREARTNLRGVNDAPLRLQTETLINVVDLVVRNHIPTPKPTIADDLSGLMKGWMAFRPPNSDPDLGRTPTLSVVRQTKGLMLAAINDALEATEKVGLRVRQPALMHSMPAEVPRGSVTSLLDSIHARLSAVEKTLDALDDARKQPTSFRQQQELLNFYVESMRVEASLTKLHLSNVSQVFDLDGVVRAIEVMSDLTGDFIETVRSWGRLLANNVIFTAERATKQILRLVRGVRATSFALMRFSKRKRIDPQRESTSENRKEEDIVSSEDEHSVILEDIDEGFEEPPPLHKHFARARRYARALTGNQEFADNLLEAALQAAVDFENSSTDWNQTTQIFRIISAIVPKLPRLTFAATVPVRDRVHKRIGRLTLGLRQVFLLSAMEGFSDMEISFILSKPPHEIAEIQEHLKYALAKIVATKVLIIEDDPLQGEALENLFVSLGHTVIGIARSADEAVRLAIEHKPGLISVDIQLGAGSGLTAANLILRTVSAVFIFVTAYPERFLTGNRPEPSFLISKPYQPAMIAAVASQGLFFNRVSSPRSR
jgi:CheY-like chemotaxis protein